MKLGSIINKGGDEEDRKGTWKGTDYNASDEEAHRDVRYSVPSWASQTLTVFMVQMKLFSKAKWTFIALFTALLIPILMIGAEERLTDILTTFGFTANSNTYIAGMLAFLPMFLGLFTSILCGTQIPSEFKDRTAYLNMSLPISRSSFYIGKYLAGLILCLGIFMFAYGSAVATATMMGYDTIFTDLLGESLMLTIIAVFAYSSTAFCVGSFMKRGSSFVPFILMSVAIPLIVVLIGTGSNWWGLSILPMFLGEAALGLLGTAFTGSVGMVALYAMDLTNIVPMVILGVVWGIAFLIIGLIVIQRREM